MFKYTPSHTRPAAYFPALTVLSYCGLVKLCKLFVPVFAYWEYSVIPYRGGCENWVKAYKHGAEWHVVYSKHLSSRYFIMNL